MTERPILFSGPMVRAILEGWKTQTRRVVKPQPPCLCTYVINGANSHALCFGPNGECVPPTARIADHRLPCPYGVPGDRLWVREKWAEGGRSMQLPCGEFVWSSHRKARYAATDDSIRDGDPSCSWRMRRWASRLTLEVVSVRVERLNGISRGDAMSEGCPFPNMAKGPDPRDWFRELWDSINAAKHPWSSNPWVWVVEFKRIDAAGGDA